MTTRKVHFDFYATQEEAWCGLEPRAGANPLALSERRKDVTCVKCLKQLEDYDAEVATSGDHQWFTEVTDADIELPTLEPVAFEADIAPAYVGPIESAWASNQSIATRHGMESIVISAAIDAGYLKR